MIVNLEALSLDKEEMIRFAVYRLDDKDYSSHYTVPIVGSFENKQNLSSKDLKKMGVKTYCVDNCKVQENDSKEIEEIKNKLFTYATYAAYGLHTLEHPHDHSFEAVYNTKFSYFKNQFRNLEKRIGTDDEFYKQTFLYFYEAGKNLFYTRNKEALVDPNERVVIVLPSKKYEEPYLKPFSTYFETFSRYNHYFFNKYLKNDKYKTAKRNTLDKYYNELKDFFYSVFIHGYFTELVSNSNKWKDKADVVKKCRQRFREIKNESKKRKEVRSEKRKTLVERTEKLLQSEKYDSSYPKELRLKVVSEYKYKEEGSGYKALARKYNLNPQVVKSWVEY